MSQEKQNTEKLVVISKHNKRHVSECPYTVTAKILVLICCMFQEKASSRKEVLTYDLGSSIFM